MADPKSRSRSREGWLLRIASQYRLPAIAITSLLLFPFLLTLLLSFFSLPVCYDLHPILWGEGKIVENTQFVIFLGAAILNFFVSWRTIVLGEKKIVRFFYFIFGLSMFFIAGEEIAWGQQLLHFKTPEFLQPFNAQNELTFHNFGFLQAKSDLLNLLFAAVGLSGVTLSLRGKINKIEVPPPLFFWFGLIFALAVFGSWFKFHLGDRPLNYPAEYIFHIQTETTELMIAMVGLIYPWLNYWAFFSIPSVKIDRKQDPKLVIHTLFPVKMTYAFVALLSGLLCLLWFAIIPGEGENALFLGLSTTRFSMLVIGIIILLSLAIAVLRATKDQTWRDSTSNRLNQMMGKPWLVWTLTLFATLVLISSWTSLIITYTQNDPFLAGILTRLAPWFLWISILSLESLLLLLPHQLNLARSRLSNQGNDMS